MKHKIFTTVTIILIGTIMIFADHNPNWSDSVLTNENQNCTESAISQSVTMLQGGYSLTKPNSEITGKNKKPEVSDFRGYDVCDGPAIINNTITNPEVNQNEKTIFCTGIPPGLAVIHGLGEPLVDDQACTVLEYMWQWRLLGQNTWSLAAGYTNASFYLLPEHDYSVQYRRLVRGTECTCDDNTGLVTDWFPSNVITIHVVPQIQANAAAIQAAVCFDNGQGEVHLEGNLPWVYKYDENGDLIEPAEKIYYANGEWSGPTEISFYPHAETHTPTVTAGYAGVFQVAWSLTPKPFTYTECTSSDPDYCCDDDSDTLDIVFESVTLSDLDEYMPVVCSEEDITLTISTPAQTASGFEATVNVTVERSQHGMVTNTLVSLNEQDTYSFTLPADYGTGVFTFTFTADSSAECPASVVALVRRLDVIPAVQANNKYVCHEQGTAFGFDVTISDNYNLAYNLLTWDDHEEKWIYGNWVTAAGEESLPTFSEPGVYGIALKYFITDPAFCQGLNVTIATLTIQENPNISDIFFSGEACYGEEITVSISHSPRAVALDWIIEGKNQPGLSTMSGTVTIDDPEATETTLTFEPYELSIGEYTFTATLHEPLESSQENLCSTTISVENLYVRPPVYVVFQPFYKKNIDGYIYDIPEQQQEETPPMIINVPVSIGMDSQLWIDFSDEVTDSQGRPLSNAIEGEFIFLWKKVNDVWQSVDIKLSWNTVYPPGGYQVFRRAVVLPYDFVNDVPVALDWDTEYMLSHNNIYKATCGMSQPVEYRLSAIKNENGDYTLDEASINAYGKSNIVYFKTMSEQYANLPSVYPSGENQRCEQLYIEFANPVRYPVYQLIAPGSNLSGKFQMEKRSDVSSEWITVDMIEQVIPSAFEPLNGQNNVEGPTRMDFVLGRELDYGMEYRIRMTPSDVQGDIVYGFWDLVLDIPVLADEYFFDTATNGLGKGWNWSSSRFYPIRFQLEPWPADWFGDQTPAAATMNNIMFSGEQADEFAELITCVISDPTEPEPSCDLVKRELPYYIDFYGGSFTVSAQDGKGYHWTGWKASRDGGLSFEELPVERTSEDPVWWKAGYDYFPQSFTWHPDTITRTHPDMEGEQVWLFPDCEEELVFVAKFAKNQYVVHALPKEYNTTPPAINNEWGEVSVSGTPLHGETITIEATPKPGYYFKGWNLDQLPESLTGEITFQYTPPVVEEIMDPLNHTAVLSIELLGDFGNGAEFIIYAVFDVFYPNLFAAIQGHDFNGGNMPNIADLEFSTLYSQNILETGEEPKGAFLFDQPDTTPLPDQWNAYDYIVFQYGNPDNNSQPAMVIINHNDVPCIHQGQFLRWERFDWTEDPGSGLGYVGWRTLTAEDGIVFSGDYDQIISFIPTQNYRLRAQYAYREDIGVDVVVFQNESYTYGDDHGPINHGNATIQVKYVGEKEDGRIGDRWVNGIPDPNNNVYSLPLAESQFSPNDILEITVFPEENYFTFYWKDMHGNEIVSDECSLYDYGIELINRKSSGGSADRSVWHYTVGCPENEVLQAVLKLNRYHVHITAEDSEGVLLTDQGEITLLPMYNPASRKFDCDVAFAYGLGFERFPVPDAPEEEFKGYFENYVNGLNTYSNFEATASALMNDPENQQVWAFVEWQEKANEEWVTYSTDENITVDEINKNLRLRALFENTFEAPKYLLTITDNIPDFNAEYFLMPESAEQKYVENTIITLENGFVAGYDFQQWLLLEGMNLLDNEGEPDINTFVELETFLDHNWDDEQDSLEEALQLFLEQPVLVFKMPAAENGVSIQAVYELHQYQITPMVRTHMTPHLIDCLIIDNMLGGQAHDNTPEGTAQYHYGDLVRLRAKANAGFTLVNWMFGEINVCNEEGYSCASNNAVTGIQINPFDLSPHGSGDGWVEFPFRIPRVDQRHLQEGIGLPVYAVFAESPQTNPYLFYQLLPQTAAYDSNTMGPWLLPGRDGVAAVKVFGENHNSYFDDVWSSYDTGAEATYAHGNTGKVWVNVDDIRAGYKFVSWDSETVSSQDGLTAKVCMNDHKQPKALFKAINYDLFLYSNEFGKVALFENDPANEMHTAYTIESPTIKITGVANETDNGTESRLLGFYYDEEYAIPVKNNSGQIVFAAEDFEDGVTEFSFYFTPVVPSEIAGPDFDQQVTIYAKFAEQHMGYEINLKTKLSNTDEYFPTPPVHALLDVNGDGSSGTYIHNENVQVATAPEWGYTFQHWKYLGGSWIIQDQIFTHKVTGPATLVAVFAATEYQLHVESTQGGTAEGEGIFTRLSKENGEPFLSAQAEPDYEFVNWTDEQGNIISSEEEFQYFVTENVFESVPYEITMTANFTLKNRDLLFNIHGIDSDDAVITLAGMVNDPGNYLFENVPFGTHNYTVEVAGFNNYYGEVVVNETTEDQIVVEFVQCPPPAVEVFVNSTQLAVEVNAEKWEFRLYEVSEVNGEEVSHLVYGPVILEDIYEYLVEDINPNYTYLPAIRGICHEPGYSVFSKSVPNPYTINTVKLGDVDGDGMITAIDVNLISAYINDMLGNRQVIMNPLELIGLEGPVFIFDAADVNPNPNGQIGDGIIDILDVVAWANIWLNQFNNNDKGILTDHAGIILSPHTVKLESDGMVSGIQFEIHGNNLKNLSLYALLPGYSLSWSVKDNLLSGVLFSLEGNSIPKGVVDIIEIENAQNLEWGNVQAANIYAQPVQVYTYDMETSIVETSGLEPHINVYPNPSRGQFNTDIHIPGPADINILLFDLNGRQVSRKQITTTGGYESISWDEAIQPGIYIMRASIRPLDQMTKPGTQEMRIVITP